MTTLSTNFKDALSAIEPDEDKVNAATAHAEVSQVLCADQRLKDLGISPALIGSYRRSVSIKHVKDVDVFARLKSADESLAPGAILDTFEEILTEEYGEDRVERQHRSIKVDFPDFKLTVDTVPARPCGDHWEIPNKPEEMKRAEWVETNPLYLNELTEKANADFKLGDNGVYVPTVKLVRQVRRTWLEDQPGGLFFELMTYWYFQNNQPSANSQAEYLVLVLNGLAEMLPDVATEGLDDPTMPDKKISTKADDNDFQIAIEKIKQAADLAQEALDDTDDCSSAVKWRDLLGQTSDGEDVFTIPGYCNNDGTRKALNTITSGATTVPAGNDRYA